MLTALILFTTLLAQPLTLDDASYTRWRDYLVPKPAETRWLNPGWRPALWAALREADQQGRPLVLWTALGHPLGATSAAGIEMRTRLWSDARAREAIQPFLPVADDATRLLAHANLEERTFRRLITPPHGVTYSEGVFFLAPSGEPLGSTNSSDPATLAETAKTAMAAWEQLSQERRKLDLSGTPVFPALRPVPPRTGLSLRVVVRDLPRPSSKPRGTYNLDFAWMRGEEAATFLPTPLRAGQVARVPDAVARRLVRLHLLDRVLGRTAPFAPEDVQVLAMATRAATVTRDQVALRIEGVATSSAVTDGRPRGVEVQMLGRARWDPRARRFVSFELVCVGSRWGGTALNGRENDLKPQPIGFLLTLSGTSPTDLAPPEWFSEYGWRPANGT